MTQVREEGARQRSEYCWRLFSSWTYEGRDCKRTLSMINLSYWPCWWSQYFECPLCDTVWVSRTSVLFWSLCTLVSRSEEKNGWESLKVCARLIEQKSQRGMLTGEHHTPMSYLCARLRSVDPSTTPSLTMPRRRLETSLYAGASLWQWPPVAKTSKVWDMGEHKTVHRRHTRAWIELNNPDIVVVIQYSRIEVLVS